MASSVFHRRASRYCRQSKVWVISEAGFIEWRNEATFLSKPKTIGNIMHYRMTLSDDLDLVVKNFLNPNETEAAREFLKEVEHLCVLKGV